MSATEGTAAANAIPKTEIESFSISLPWVRDTAELRLDASFYNPRVAAALALLKRSGLPLKPLREVTKRIFIPPRFARIYVGKDHGLPFLQGSHVVHFQPPDLKYVSRTAHKNIENWIIRKGWVLVTRSGSVGRVSVVSTAWDGWAASEHILRIIPDSQICPPGYLYAYLSCELGQAQLTSQIYGAVVDEITEDQARSVLIPVPRTTSQRALVAEISKTAMDAMRMRDRAAGMADSSIAEIVSLVPELGRRE